MVSVLAIAALPGCTADDAAGRAAPGSVPATSTSAPPPSAMAPPPAPAPTEPVPVARDAGYADAVASFGEAQVQQAVTDHARIARIALADCHRWTTGRTDPALTGLLDPALLNRVEEELRRPPGSVPSLLSHLPDDDGNGHDLAAAVRTGCDGSGPLRYDTGGVPNAVHVDRSDGGPRLVQVASYAVTVTFGGTVVGAGQDWVLTSTPTASGWRLTDAAATAQVNWFPA
ncbi:hypothetical protein SAMN05660464_0135 [Geodermatophilus dictyosporus]|uniref:Uncharacterized protein n=1 Tax=Geodermatophilus dictyosporus TaxID=1523247 RepID=A0A1I5U7U8_9ACTN|nr:hypothetical protein SAMN05660464_0135 [Geodermatophilus dictyosporus]